MNTIKDLTYRHRRFHPLKVDGNASRRDEWGDLNWRNTNQSIARFLHVTQEAVRKQRQKRGIAPYKFDRKVGHHYAP